jgi:hypothetical protein
MKRISAWLVFLCLCIFCISAVSACGREDTAAISQTEKTEAASETVQPTVPSGSNEESDATEEIITDSAGKNTSDAAKASDKKEGTGMKPEVNWSAGLFAHFFDLPMYQNKKALRSYEYEGGVVAGYAEMASSSAKKEPFSLLILADGRPVTFMIDGENYVTYDVELDSAGERREFSFDPGFSEKGGRIDFILCVKKGKFNEYHLVRLTIVLGHPDSLPEDFGASESIGLAGVRSGLKNVVNGYTFSAWLREPDDVPEESDNINFSAVEIDKTGKVRLEAIAGCPTEYRMIFLVNDKPIEVCLNGKTVDHIDWKSREGEMIEDIIQIDESAISDSSSFFVLITPLDPELMDQPCLGSRNHEITREK